MSNFDYILTSEGELYHYGIPGMKWGRRKKVEYTGEGIVSQKKPKLPGMVKGGPEKLRAPGMVKGGPEKLRAPGIAKYVKSKAGVEMAKRGRAALDVLMNGDKDWMGNSISSNDMGSEARNRGKAALERLMYSQEQIDNKKFFGSYNPFD